MRSRDYWTANLVRDRSKSHHGGTCCVNLSQFSSSSLGMNLNFSINNVFTWRVQCVIPISRAIFGSGVKFDSWHASHEICIACFLLIYSLIIGHVELEMIWTGQLVRNVQPIAGPSADYLCVRRIGCWDVGADQSQRSVADRWPSDAAQLVFAFVNLKKKFFLKKKGRRREVVYRSVWVCWWPADCYL